MSATKELVVTHAVGLHARPAAMFVRQAGSFKSKIMVTNLNKKTQPANAKSMLGVLSIGVQRDDRILIWVDGEDENEALLALSQLIESNFGEGAG